MPKKEYDTNGGLWQNDYGWNLKVELPDGTKLNWYFSKPHPDYVKDTSPEWFIKTIKEGNKEEEPDTPF